MAALPDADLDQLFRHARSNNAWESDPIPEATLRAVYELAKWGPTQANSNPVRFVFVTSVEGREKLASLATGSNPGKIRQSPCTVVVGLDMDFPEHMPKLFPHAPDAKHWFDDPEARKTAAWRNSSLQAGYFIVAARALGLDCGPMSGMDFPGVKQAFFAGTNIEPNMMISLGRGRPEGVHPRNPRLAFEEAAKIV
jgi:3-hydroxypropanoate dehydrogenase